MVVIGMGGSGISGDVLHAIGSPLLPVPVTVVKGYECPHFVIEASLVFAVSCSGGTEETIEAASDAALAGAKMVVVASGGELAPPGRGVAGAHRRPCPTVPWPRVAFGSMAVPLLVVLWRMGFLPGADLWVERAVEQLKWRRDDLVSGGASFRGGGGGTPDRPHRALACTEAGRWAPSPPSAGRPRSTRTPSGLAFAATQPELCHNEVCGWAEAPSRSRG